jgi:hypothetical protein
MASARDMGAGVHGIDVKAVGRQCSRERVGAWVEYIRGTMAAVNIAVVGSAHVNYWSTWDYGSEASLPCALVEAGIVGADRIFTIGTVRTYVGDKYGRLLAPGYSIHVVSEVKEVPAGLPASYIEQKAADVLFVAENRPANLYCDGGEKDPLDYDPVLGAPLSFKGAVYDVYSAIGWRLFKHLKAGAGLVGCIDAHAHRLELDQLLLDRGISSILDIGYGEGDFWWGCGRYAASRASTCTEWSV